MLLAVPDDIDDVAAAQAYVNPQTAMGIIDVRHDAQPRPPLKCKFCPGVTAAATLPPSPTPGPSPSQAVAPT